MSDQDILTTIGMLADQCQQAWEETKDIVLPTEYSQITNAVVPAMGGSHLGAQLINSVYKPTLKVPLIVCNDYQVPGYVTDQSLVLATSFSGSTEETLRFVDEAHKRHAKIICITSGGKLGNFATANNLPSYIFESKYNPSKIPRYGSGYLFTAQMSFLAKAGIIQLIEADFKKVLQILRTKQNNDASQQFASELKQKSIILVASEHLIGSAYIFKNQLNESAKNFATLFEIPELNHHLLEGLQYPNSNKTNLRFFFFESNLYFDRNQKRYAITKEIIEQQGISTSTYKPQSASQLEQAFETLSFTSYVSYFLSLLNNVDPAPNPWVDYLKQKLT